MEHLSPWPPPESAELPSESARLRPPWSGWRWVRYGAFAVYIVYFVIRYRSDGVPWDRERLFAWIISALLITCIGRSWKQAARLLVDWIPYLVIFAAYDFSRGLADNVGLPLQVRPQINVDKWVFFGKVPTVWLQDRLYRKGVIRWWDYPVAITYMTHFFVPVVVGGILWAKNRRLYQQWVCRLMTLTFLGVIVFVLAPTAPPWMASDRHEIGHTDRIAQRGWNNMHLHWAHVLWEKGANSLNAVAAVPSLHAGYAALLTVFFWSKVKPWLRPLLLVHPALMLFTIVYGGEHYVSDALAAYVLIALSCWMWNRIEAWWDRRSVVDWSDPDADGGSGACGSDRDEAYAL